MHITLPRPDDWHLHLRDGAMLQAVAPHTARAFGRALIMPNLAPPVVTAEQATAYAGRIRAAAGSHFEPLMTCYLTDEVDGDALVQGFRQGAWVAAKLYPANATTNSAHGVTDLQRIRPALERMAEAGMPLCVHGEVTDPHVDVFDRESIFLHEVLGPLLEAIPTLRVVVEHATTRTAIDFVRGQSDGVAATLTPHHLWWNRNALFDGGLRPHAYCLPVLKRETDRAALIGAATSGDPRFFAGTDSAPHLRSRKECDHGCAGVFNAPTALAAYAQVFEDAAALEHLEGFLSRHGAAFYGVQVATETVTLVAEPWTPQAAIEADGEAVSVFLGDEQLRWRLQRGG
ncbi:MAG: dihydroorotase [Myxococcales bacterium]|nr:dihydroorotase [Myxococcales bacterium]